MQLTTCLTYRHAVGTSHPRWVAAGIETDRATQLYGRHLGKVPKPLFKPPENLYRGEYICTRGRLRLFEGVPEMFVSSPGAIEIRGE